MAKDKIWVVEDDKHISTGEMMGDNFKFQGLIQMAGLVRIALGRISNDLYKIIYYFS